MDRLPLHRRPGAASLLGAALLLGLYLWARLAAPDLSPLAPPVAAALAVTSLIALFIFLGQLIPSGGDLGTALGELARMAIVGLWIAVHAAALLGLPGWPSRSLALSHLDLVITALFGMLALAAQFVLPVRMPAERAAAVGRVLRALAGRPGPVLFVHNGRALDRSDGRPRRGPGVLVIDHDSAAVLRTDTRFTGAVGPGVTLAADGERLAEALDLRRQTRRLPAAPPGRSEAQAQSSTSLAVTQDGITVSAELAVVFQLHPGGSAPPRAGDGADAPAYDFFPQSALRAVQGHAFSGRADVPWTRLPLLLAVDLWREEVRAVELPALLRGAPGESSALAAIEGRILARLTRPDAPGPGGARPDREFRMLQARGTRVLEFTIRDLTLPDDVRAEHLLRWHESWSGAVREALHDAEQEAAARRAEGRRQAQHELAEALSGGLRARLAQGEAPSRRETLSLILMDALRLCNRSEMSPEGGPLAAQLSRIRTQVQGLDADGTAPPPGRGA